MCALYVCVNFIHTFTIQKNRFHSWSFFNNELLTHSINKQQRDKF